jgi:hypothetical protein
MKYSVEMGSGVMIYIPIEIGSGIKKLIGGIHRHTDSMVIYKPTLIFSKSKSKLLYDWRFTANQFVLASSPLRPTTRFFFFS